MEKYLFTISIPTYNRSKSLDLCLAQICKQLPGTEQFIELIVSDNNSTDDTEEIVRKYISQGHHIKYVKNKNNIGAEKNVYQCYNLANGKYVLIFGDDDMLADDSLNKIIPILKNGDYGVIYLKGVRRRFTVKNVGKQACEYTVYNDTKNFIKAIHYYLTFISGNIFNKSIVDMDLPSDMNQIIGSQLPQLRWTLSALFNAKRNVVIEDILLAANLAGTGNFQLCEVFGISQNKIFDVFIKKGINKEFFEIINRKLIQIFLPRNILAIRQEKAAQIRGKDNYIEEDFYKTLYPIYHNYLYFWLFTMPVIKLPLFAARIWFFGTIVSRKLPEIPGFFARLWLSILLINNRKRLNHNHH